MLKIDCGVGEGGGGLVRVSLPLAVLTGQSVELVNIRSRRDPATRGIGWTHLAFIEAVCAWTGAKAQFSGLGATQLTFAPSSDRPAAAERLTIDLDDAARTFATSDIDVMRDYDGGSDHFKQNIDNRMGRGVRGHSIAMFLIGLLPLLATTRQVFKIRAMGSTETPGGPFIDAIEHCLYPAASEMTRAALECEVASRGCMGSGGGEVLATIRPESRASHSRACLNVGSSVQATYYVFGDESFYESSSEQLHKAHRLIEQRLSTSMIKNIVYVPYAARSVQTIFLIAEHQSARDVSVCWEERWGLAENFVDACTLRLGAELKFTGLASRFIVEQLLPLAAVTPGLHTFKTEKLTNHAVSVIHVIEALTASRVRWQEDSGAVEIAVECA